MSEEEIKEQTKVLKEMLKWIKITGMKEVKDVLVNALADDAKKLVYHYSDGERTTRDFAILAGVKRANTISDYWKEWKRLGILEGVSAKGGERGKKVFDLENFGIEIPKPIIKEEQVNQQEVVPVAEQTTIAEETASNG